MIGKSGRLILIVFLLAGAGAAKAFSESASPARSAPSIDIYFSPRGGCQETIIREINAARRSIRVQAYTFTNADIAKALRDAHRRGVDVEAILDKSQRTARYSSATFLHNVGIRVLIDDKHAIAHNKIMILDGETIITGSFNFSRAAEESNAENLLILKGFPEVAAAYRENYAKHRSHSLPYIRPGVPENSSPGNRGSEFRQPASGRSLQAQSLVGPGAAAVVYITRTGAKYHRAGCSSLSQSSIPIRLPEAKRRGYTPPREV
jgi:phosphatidylserine/phosphatidylglycerophosphate/cardiolipin synthase-like enzyme